MSISHAYGIRQQGHEKKSANVQDVGKVFSSLDSGIYTCDKCEFIEFMHKEH
jgi:hypothetical protein